MQTLLWHRLTLHPQANVLSIIIQSPLQLHEPPSLLVLDFSDFLNKFPPMIGIIFIIILDTVLINYDQDGNCRNKSGLSTFLPVWTADEWGTYHHHPHRAHPHHAGEQARQRGRQAGHDGGSAENSKNCKNCETCVRNIREVIMMTVLCSW